MTGPAKLQEYHADFRCGIYLPWPEARLAPMDPDETLAERTAELLLEPDELPMLPARNAAGFALPILLRLAIMLPGAGLASVG